MRTTFLFSALICYAAGAVLRRTQQPLTSGNSSHLATWNLPVAAAWLYMSDDQNYTTIPSTWSSVDFSVVDVLYLGPAGVQKDNTFGLFDSNSTGPLSNRFKWVLQRARSQNPDIKVLASQWWGTGLPGNWGSALSALNGSAAISQYTDSVAAFVEEWSGVAGGIDGFDIDYESNNVLPTVPTILSQIRSKFDTLSSTKLGGKPLYITVSPADTQYLDKASPSINYCNMQTYAGGSEYTPKDFIELGFSSEQLLYGYCPETGCDGPSLSDVEEEYTMWEKKNQTLAGTHTWRLNSGNYKYEDKQQGKLYKFLHP